MIELTHFNLMDIDLRIEATLKLKNKKQEHEKCNQVIALKITNEISNSFSIGAQE